MHANLTEDESQVILDNLPEAPAAPQDRALYDAGKRRLEASVASSAHAFYIHLLAQGKSKAEAKAHVRHRFGVGPGGVL